MKTVRVSAVQSGNRVRLTFPCGAARDVVLAGMTEGGVAVVQDALLGGEFHVLFGPRASGRDPVILYVPLGSGGFSPLNGELEERKEAA
ncbi:hypothetical protein IHN63_00485 [Deinococcus sp. 6YEL10]|uniref:hypothetical protein n=1 Tax=Deinococcus sp. 6YEL10 TaxID=2745870 RepID=UPI001E47C7A8|nr:hypothetical protein [Deinococcus sp. 6YEL10]MCD0159776.1 hypothetical protein [Deinococcus sp. 6YEL10]